MIIHVWNSEIFVFDPTGYRFGFGDYVFRWEEYQAAFGLRVEADLDIEFEEEYAAIFYKRAHWHCLDNLRKGMVAKTKEEILRGEFWQ
jgi:hypothetical protein